MNPFKLFKRFTSKAVPSLNYVALENGQKTYCKTYERICCLFSENLASRKYVYSHGDGLHTLLQAGFKPILKKALDLCMRNGKSYIPIHFDDVSESLNEEVKEFSCWELGNVVSQLPNGLHPSRYVVLSDWKSSQEREALKSVCQLFDEAVLLLNDGLNFALHPYVQVGDLNSLLETRSYTLAEREELKNILSRLTSSKSYILGREDKVSSLNPSSSVIGMFRHLASYLSFLSGLPLSYLLPEEKAEFSSHLIFYKEIDALSQLIIKPVIQQLMLRLNLESRWQFKELSTISSKEQIESELKKAQTASLWVETLKSCEGNANTKLEQEIYQKVLTFLNLN